MGISLNELRKNVAENDKVLVTVVTDGYENASKEYDGKAIKALVDELKAKGWVFAYIGANQDAKAVSKSLGIVNALNFEATVCGTRKMGAMMNASRERWFSRIADNDANANEDFFDEK